MKADHIIKNAKIYTADKKNPQASGPTDVFMGGKIVFSR